MLRRVLFRDFNKKRIIALQAGTSQAEVRRKFGKPQDTAIAPEGDELWTYTYTKASATRRGLSVETGPSHTKTTRLRFREGKLVKEDGETEIPADESSETK